MLDFMGREPNWLIVSLVGAVLGALVARYGGVLSYPMRRLRPLWMEGGWHMYHVTFRNGEIANVPGKMRVRRGLLAGLAVEIEDAGERGVLRYRGKAAVEGSHFTVQGEAVSHTESICIRFLYKVPQPGVVVPGLWLSFDQDGPPAAGVVLATMCELEEGTSMELLRRYVDIQDGAMRVLSVPRS